MRFSIVIPTRDRASLLNRCLTAIGELDFPRGDFEVLVIDDGSRTEPIEIVERHASQINLRYYHRNSQGPARTRNWGLHCAQGEYVVFIDDDCAPQASWLSEFNRAFENRPAAGLGGKVIPALGSSAFGRASQMLITFLYDDLPRHNPPLAFFCSNNLAFPRQVLIDMGGFDESFKMPAAEDRELCTRWNASNELLHVCGAVVEHRQILNLWSFLIQHFRYGSGAAHFWSKWRVLGRPDVSWQAVQFYLRMLAYPFVEETWFRAVLLSLLLLLSQISNLTGYFFGRLRSRNTTG